MSEKKSKRLSISDRTNIMERLINGETGASLAAEYGVTNSTISWIKKRKENILKQQRLIDDAHRNSSKKKFSGAENSELDKCLYQWFVQKRSIGDHVSGSMLQEKAFLFNERLNGPTSFKASYGFLHRFKVRHGIKLLPIQREKVFANTETSQTFSEEIVQYLQEKGYGMDQIYNADETSLLWKTLPSKILVTDGEDCKRRKKIKDRVTIMVCANASGTHKLPLFVVGKSERSECFRNIKVLPVTYRDQKSAWMNRKLTIDWYKEVFLPEIEKVHGPSGEKCILLLDNASSHPPINEFSVLSDKCEVKYLPPNVTSLIQPMDQGVIEKMKKVYKRKLLRLVLTEETVEGVQRLINSLTTLHCCNFVASAWSEVTEMDIRNGWNNLFPQDISAMNIDYDLRLDAFCDMIRQLPGQEELTIQDTKQWLTENNDDPGWRILSDEEIISGIELDDDWQLEDDEENVDGEDAAQSARTALSCVDGVIAWYQTRLECTPKHLRFLEYLRSLSIDEILAEKMRHRVT